MSQENVDIVRNMHRTAGADLTAGLHFMAPDIELHLTRVFPDLEPVYRGHEGVKKFVALFNAPWEDLSVEVDRYIDLGDRVLSISTFHGKGRDGVEVVMPLAHIWTLRDGQIARMDAYADHSEALKAVGLAE
jgi:ketosteroid isomerase-like protein